MDIKDKIIDHIEQKLYTIGVFIDFKKAFDSIKHHILLKKLGRYGIRGICSDLVKSYLSNRFQYTEIDHARSKLGKLNYGVPQGSILGPLLFLLYINDIVNISSTADIVLYADDTNMFFSGSDLGALQLQTNSWLEKLSVWLEVNQLYLNTNKTKFVIFRAKNKELRQTICIKFRDKVIEQVSSHQFLGVTFNENLNWSPHVNRIRTDISRAIGIIYKLNQLLPAWLKKQLYYALVHSRLSYCSLVWGTTGKVNLDHLHILQKKVLRLIENKPPRSHAAPLFHKHNILTIGNIINQKFALFIYHQFKHNPDAFMEKYTLSSHEYNLRHAKYNKERIRTNYGSQKTTYIIPDLLNKHPDIHTLIQSSLSITPFKKKIAEYLLELQ